MYLKRLVLKQVCQFKHTELNFGLGTTGIFGRNGAGKSNSLKLAYANLTNDYHRNPFTKEEHIRDAAPKGARSEIHAEWFHGVDFSITRGLQPDDHRMVIGAETLTTAKTIEQRVTSTLGISRQIIDNYVFVPQWQVTAFLSAKPTDRAVMFSHLCRTVVAGQVHKLLGEQIKADMPLIGDTYDNADEVRQRRRAEQQAIANLRCHIADWQPAVQSPEATKVHRRRIRKRAKYLQLRTERTHRLSQHQSRLGKFDELIKKLGELSITLADLESVVRGLAPGAKDAETQLAQLAQRQKQQEHRKELAEQLAALVQPVKPKKPDGLREEATLRKYLAQLQATQERTSAIVANFDETGIVDCPTCGTLAEDLAEHVQHMAVELATARDRIPGVRASLAVIDEYHQQRAKYDRELASYEATVASLTATLAKLPPEEEIVDTMVYTRAINMHKRRVDDMNEAHTEFTKLSGHKEKYLEWIANAEGELTRLAEEMQKNKISSATAALSEKYLADSASAKEDIAVARGQIKLRKEIIASCDLELERIEAYKARGANAKKWIEYLEQGRSLFHHEALPRIVADGYMGELADQINKNLEDFGSPFVIRPGDDLGFVYRKGRGKERTAAALSGGEAVVLAISFRIAVNAIFASHIGMMVLDEPTEGLDDDNMDCLEGALRRLAEISRARGHQVIMITHQRGLERVFDQFIQL